MGGLAFCPGVGGERLQFGSCVESGGHRWAVVLRRPGHAVEAVGSEDTAIRIEDGAGVAVGAPHADARRIPLGVGRLAGDEA